MKSLQSFRTSTVPARAGALFLANSPSLPVDLKKTRSFSVSQIASLRSLKTDCSTSVAKPVLRQRAFRGVVLILIIC